MMNAFRYVILGSLAVVVLMSVSAAALPDEAQGRLKAVFPDKREVVVADSAGTETTFQLAQDGKVLINNAESNLGDLEPGDTIVVVHQGQPAVASQIRCRRD
jgi:hypothetical protein